MMETKTKYYTPDIEDMHVGIEYILSDNQGREYKKTMAVDSDLKDIDHDINKGAITIKCLDKDDLISLGYTEEEDEFFNDDEFEFTRVKTIIGLGTGDDKKIKIIHTTGDNNVFIYSRENRGREETLFDGTIKNKSELKKLLKQLGLC